MATSQMSEIIQYLRRALLPQDGAGLTDGQLLEDFISRQDEPALAALVRRHAPMVWGVCRRVLHNHHDAEDAFQATFLVFVRKAASIASRELLANWLYGVAHQTALRARATAARRKERERQVAEMPEPAVAEQDLWRDLQPLLDAEVSRLPNKYRSVIVLCDLQGKTRKEAAQQLGWPEGTVAGRLARARTMLAKRLARHALGVSAGALPAALSQQAASGCVPTALVSSTIKAASLSAAGQAATTGLISAKVAALGEGVLKAMFLTKLKIAVVVLFGTTVLGIAVGGLTRHIYAGQSASNEAGSARTAVQRAEVSRADERPKTDKDHLQGSWVVFAWEEEGMEIPEEKVKDRNAELVFSGDKVTLPIKGESKEAEYNLHPSKNPKGIDLVVEGKTLKGIYLLEGDTLKLCVQKDADGERPAKFATEATTNVQLGLKRKK
jgi:RNA polymerase sigma-70 factor (ECF subfamily)